MSLLRVLAALLRGYAPADGVCALAKKETNGGRLNYYSRGRLVNSAKEEYVVCTQLVVDGIASILIAVSKKLQENQRVLCTVDLKLSLLSPLVFAH